MALHYPNDPNARVDNSDNEDEDEDAHGTAAAAVPSTGDAMAAIKTLRRFLYAAPSSDTAQEQLMDGCRSFIVKGCNRYIQSSVTDFFHPQI